MNEEKLRAFATTPRLVDDELTRLVGNRSRGYELGCGGVVAGGVALLASVGVVFFSNVGFACLGASLLLALASAALMIATRSKGQRMAAEAARDWPVVLVGVVQGNESLFQPERAYAGAVMVYATDPARGLDAAWVTRMVAGLQELKGTGHADPVLAKLVQELWDPGSLPDVALPTGFTEGVPARVYATAIDAGELPEGKVPESRLVPALLDDAGHPIILPARYWA